MEWGAQDLAHARNAADLALKHLRDSLERGDDELIEELGWTPEQARAFLERWRTLSRMARSQNPRERGEYARVMQSLGLRPDRVRGSREAPADAEGGQAESRRSRPPRDYREQFRAFLQGTAGE